MKNNFIKTISFFLIIGVFFFIIFYKTIFKEKHTSLSLSKSVNEFDLVTHEGNSFDTDYFYNYPSLIFFGFLNCPDVCPFTLIRLSKIIDKLDTDKEKLKYYFVTVDPERDDKEAIKNYLLAFNEDIIGITGSSLNIKKFLKHMHVYSKKVFLDDENYTMDHSSQMFIFNKKGNFSGTISSEESMDIILNKLKRVINGA